MEIVRPVWPRAWQQACADIYFAGLVPGADVLLPRSDSHLFPIEKMHFFHVHASEGGMPGIGTTFSSLERINEANRGILGSLRIQTHKQTNTLLQCERNREWKAVIFPSLASSLSRVRIAFFDISIF